jgi:hypothetical protein
VSELTERRLGRVYSDPQTLAQWQEAADAAVGCLALESARLYGFVTGGPDVNVERCTQIIERAREFGVHPNDEAVDRFVVELLGAETPE